MITFTVSGSIDNSSNVTPSLGSYKATAFGSCLIGDTGRTPIALIRNDSTGSVNLRLNDVTVSVSPRGDTIANDVTFVLGGTATGTVSGSAVSVTKVDPAYPVSVAGVFGATISGPTMNDASNGFLVPAQSQLLSTSPNPPIVITDVNAQTLTDDPIILAPGDSYVVSLKTTRMVSGGSVNFIYVAEFGWDEIA